MADAGRQPFLFHFVFEAAVVVALLAFLCITARPTVGSAATWRALWRLLPSRVGAVSVACSANVVAFAWSTRFVDPAVAAIVFEMWVVIFIAVRARYDGRTPPRRYTPLRWGDYLLAGGAVGGVALVTLSHSGGDGLGSRPVGSLLAGVALAAGAAAMAGVGAAYKFRIGGWLHRTVGGGRLGQELATLLLVTAVIDGAAGLVSLAVAVVRGSGGGLPVGVGFDGTQVLVTAAGAVAVSAGAVLLAGANLDDLFQGFSGHMRSGSGPGRAAVWFGCAR